MLQSNFSFRLFKISAFLFSATGLFYGILKYFFKIETEFGLMNHPLQVWGLNTHLISAFIGLFAFGVLFQFHVLKKLKNNEMRRRKSGLGLMIFLLLATSSGYLIQVHINDFFHQGMLFTHMTTSALFMILCPWHLRT